MGYSKLNNFFSVQIKICSGGACVSYFTDKHLLLRAELFQYFLIYMPNSWGYPKLELKPEDINIATTQAVAKEISKALENFEEGYIA